MCSKERSKNPPELSPPGGFIRFGSVDNPWAGYLFAFFQIYGILLFEREKFFLQKNRDSKFSIILIIKEIMVNKKRRKL